MPLGSVAVDVVLDTARARRSAQDFFGSEDTLAGARMLLVAAGMQRFGWPYAAPCYTRLDNCHPHPILGQAAWNRRYGEEFTGR